MGAGRKFRECREGVSVDGNIVILTARTCQDPSSPLLASDEAFDLYLVALSRSGGAKNIAAAVRRRDSLLSMSSGGAMQQPSFSTMSHSPHPSSASHSAPPPVSHHRAAPSSHHYAPPSGPSGSGTLALDPLTAAEDVGGRARPVHVVLEESKSFTAMRVFKSLGVTALYAFCGYHGTCVHLIVAYLTT
jgi:ATP-dependent metalloprotease